MLHEEECVILKESNMEDPLADPLELPTDLFEDSKSSEESKTSEESESELSESDETNKDSNPSIQEDKDNPEVVEEVINEENYPYECETCEKRFKTKPGFLIHIKYVHNKIDKKRRRKYKKVKYSEQQYKCKICVYCTYSKNTFKNHMSKHQRHDEKFLQSEEYEIRCELCMAPIRSVKSLSCHMRVVHPKEKSQCGVCLMKFKVRTTLKRHLKNLHPEVAPEFIKKIDEELEKERAIRRETRPERQRLQRKERKQRQRIEKKEQKIRAKLEKKEREKQAKLEKKRQKKLKIEQEKLRKIKNRERRKVEKNSDDFVIKEEPFDFPETKEINQTITRLGNSEKSPGNVIPIKEEPAIEINEIIQEFTLS